MVAAAALDCLLHRSIVVNIDGESTGCDRIGPAPKVSGTGCPRSRRKMDDTHRSVS
jgi:hypothetical protein